MNHKSKYERQRKIYRRKPNNIYILLTLDSQRFLKQEALTMKEKLISWTSLKLTLIIQNRRYL